MPPQPASRARGIVLMLCTGLLWSTAGVVTRHIDRASGAEITFWRSAFCALAMVAIVTILHRGEAAARSADAAPPNQSKKVCGQLAPLSVIQA